MRIDIRKKLCLNFCTYYKSSKDKELACRGFLIVEKLIEEGWGISFEKSGEKVGQTTVEMLILNMCKNCSFYENDCDFAASPPHPPLRKGGQRGDKIKKILPCGGFILLGQLIEMDIIGIDDIIRLKDNIYSDICEY